MADYQAGFNAKGRFNSLAYAIQTYTCRDTTPSQDVSNTEGIPGNPNAPENLSPGTEARIGGLSRLEGNVKNATFDVLANPFAAPFSIQSNRYISFRIFVNGTTGVSWYTISFYVETAEMSGDVHALQPVTFSGYSDGDYQVPYN